MKTKNTEMFNFQINTIILHFITQYFHTNWCTIFSVLLQ